MDQDDQDDRDDEAPRRRRPRGTLRELNTKVAVHATQLENGQKAFSSLTEKLNELDRAVTPKPINWTTIVFGGFGVLGTIIGVVWLLAFLFGDRPTRDELDKTMSGQKQTLEGQSTDIRDLRDQQIEQKMLIKAVETQVGETDRKIDVLLKNTDRLAPR